jgi:hypothetical protein
MSGNYQVYPCDPLQTIVYSRHILSRFASMSVVLLCRSVWRGSHGYILNVGVIPWTSWVMSHEFLKASKRKTMISAEQIFFNFSEKTHVVSEKMKLFF